MEEICSPHPTLSYSDHSGDDARSDGICSLHHLLHSPSIQPSGDGDLWLVIIDVSYGKLLYGA